MNDRRNQAKAKASKAAARHLDRIQGLLQGFSEGIANQNANDCSWGEVGSLNEVERKLAELTAFYFPPTDPSLITEESVIAAILENVDSDGLAYPPVLRGE